MNSLDDHRPYAAQFDGAVQQKCFVCGDPVADHCFCKIHSKVGEPIVLCCPSCALQYLNSARTPADSREQELRAYENGTHFFIGDDKPWL